MDGAKPRITRESLCQNTDMLLLTGELKITHWTVNVPHLSVPNHMEDAGGPSVHYAAITWPKWKFRPHTGIVIAQVHVGVPEVRVELQSRLQSRSVVTLTTLPNGVHV
jgi:hypothetical protein